MTVNGILSVNSGSILTLSALGTTITVNGAVNQYGTISFPAETSSSGHTYFAGTASFTSYAGATTIWNGCASTSGVLQTSTGSIRVTGVQTFNPAASYVFNGITAAKTGNNFPATCANLTVNNNNTAGLTLLTNTLAITGTLTVGTGASLTTAGLLTLKSTSITNSAVVAPVLGTISGNVTVERYIPFGFRAYRDIAPEVYGTSTIFNSWQEGGSYSHSGYGTFITGPTAYPGLSANAIESSTDFDESATTASNTQDYTFANGTWTPLANTKTTTLDAFTGYRLLIRGDRSANLYTTPSINTQSGLQMYNPTTLRATGSLVYGTVTYNTVANGGVVNTATGGNTTVGLNATPNGFSLVANPYVCPVQWGTGSGSNSATTTVYGASVAAAAGGINGSYWYLDPTSGATGKYIAFNALTGSATVSGLGTYSNTGSVPVSTGYIQPGQAVFVQSLTSSPKVVFLETAKASTSTKASVFGTASLSKIYVSLLKQGTVGYNTVDGAAIAFNTGFDNTAYGPQDAIKFSGSTDNLYISDKGKNLSIDGRLPATANDAISLKISNPTATAYQLTIDASKYINNGFEPVLYDAFKNTTKALGTGTSTISITIDAANAATFQNRFTILFAPSALPVNSIVASASLSNKVATITWNTVGEKGVARYEVEKSTDAKTFATIGQSTAKNTATASYATTDNSVTATTYYRIKAVSTTGAVSYSNVAKLSTDNRLPSYSLYPNPLKGSSVVNISLTNVVAGKYTVSIYNALGQKVNEQTISHTGGSATHALTISNGLAAGVYNVAISEAGSKQLVHQSTLSIQP